jgi:hypothetical protein
VVVGLLLYAISARDPHQEPGFFDGPQLLLVVCALLVDALALWAIVARISEFGFQTNFQTRNFFEFPDEFSDPQLSWPICSNFFGQFFRA